MSDVSPQVDTPNESKAETKTETKVKTPEEMNDAEFRKAVLDSLTSLGDSHIKLATKLKAFIDKWDLSQKAGKF